MTCLDPTIAPMTFESSVRSSTTTAFTLSPVPRRAAGPLTFPSTEPEPEMPDFAHKLCSLTQFSPGAAYPGFFLSTFEKTQRRKNSNKTWLKKKLSQFCLQNSKYRRPFFTTKLKKTPNEKKMAFLPKKLIFSLQNSMYRRPPALTGLQKSGQKNSLV